MALTTEELNAALLDAAKRALAEEGCTLIEKVGSPKVWKIGKGRERGRVAIRTTRDR